MKLSLQFFGGRGASSAGGTSAGSMNVPYDRWGKMVDEQIRDEDGTIIGYVEDRNVYEYEEMTRPITKKDILETVDAWRNDDGTYGDEDTAIHFAYKDGTFIDATDLNGKAYKKTGLVGVSFSGADDEMVWGGDMYKGKLRMWQTWSEDGKSGSINSHRYYKAVSTYKVRTRVTYEPVIDKDGKIKKYQQVRKTIRKSQSIKL